jgi:heterodisulfide reductase subunit A
VEILELALSRTIEIDADYVVLAAGMVPNEQSTAKLQDILKVPRGADGFFMERHAKLGPVETTTEGVFLAGCVSVEPTTCVVEQMLCRACSECVEICQYHAPALVEVSPGLKAAQINQALCKGCGTCASWCPTGAIQALHFTDEQIHSMMEAMLIGEPTR